MQQLVSRLVDPDDRDRKHCAVIGVAELYGHLYVIKNKSKCIHVSLADKPYSMLGDVPLDGVIEPTDLAASAVDNCLYISDVGEDGCVWRVKVEEEVTERSVEHVELKLDQKLSDFEVVSAESPNVSTGCTQRSDKDYDMKTEQLNSNNSSAAAAEACIADDMLQAASVAEDASIIDSDAQNEKCKMSKMQDEASKVREPISRDTEQCGHVGIDLQEFIRMLSGGEVNAVNVTETAQNKPQLSSAHQMELMKDEDAGETMSSFLERTGLMRKISERAGMGPRMFEVSQHYSVKRFVFSITLLFVMLCRFIYKVILCHFCP